MVFQLSHSITGLLGESKLIFVQLQTEQRYQKCGWTIPVQRIFFLACFKRPTALETLGTINLYTKVFCFFDYVKFVVMDVHFHIIVCTFEYVTFLLFGNMHRGCFFCKNKEKFIALKLWVQMLKINFNSSIQLSHIQCLVTQTGVVSAH